MARDVAFISSHPHHRRVKPLLQDTDSVSQVSLFSFVQRCRPDADDSLNPAPDHLSSDMGIPDQMDACKPLKTVVPAQSYETLYTEASSTGIHDSYFLTPVGRIPLTCFP